MFKLIIFYSLIFYYSYIVTIKCNVKQSYNNMILSYEVIANYKNKTNKQIQKEFLFSDIKKFLYMVELGYNPYKLDSYAIGNFFDKVSKTYITIDLFDICPS